MNFEAQSRNEKFVITLSYGKSELCLEETDDSFVSRFEL